MALTTLLVLYTLFNHSSTILPATAYIKMIDVWFLQCILILFVIIITHVVIEHLDKADQGSAVHPVIKVTNQGPTESSVSLTTNRPELIMRVMRVYLIPVIVVMFNVVYWTVLVSAVE